jgi:hypothetical protein
MRGLVYEACLQLLLSSRERAALEQRILMCLTER